MKFKVSKEHLYVFPPCYKGENFNTMVVAFVLVGNILQSDYFQSALAHLYLSRHATKGNEGVVGWCEGAG